MYLNCGERNEEVIDMCSWVQFSVENNQAITLISVLVLIRFELDWLK